MIRKDRGSNATGTVQAKALMAGEHSAGMRYLIPFPAALQV
ncbi:hypothetical protein WQQ_27820 [Hydrocarboniphaga effusa AP103]|jgi:hypothetical protein|uniref:Uncharacterized protein n=1 Tax=Hydrocarboniphaga effusa AP103 TaxID=1172194 RepID=I8T5J3_9GAMM|nr:hypothetical protein WQQ_27820 [Hydrocarboniphaga effusa AP103]